MSAKGAPYAESFYEAARRPRPERRVPPVIRLLDKTLVQPHGCWTFTGKETTGGGYAKVTVNLKGQPQRQIVGHRLVYEHFRGAIGDGLQLDHLCRNRMCLNPDHLEPVSCRENLLRGETLAALNLAKTRCAHGHEFVQENIYLTARGSRRCRACHRENQRAYIARRAVN